MKLSKTRLKQIIKEEIEKLSEQELSDRDLQTGASSETENPEAGAFTLDMMRDIYNQAKELGLSQPVPTGRYWVGEKLGVQGEPQIWYYDVSKRAWVHDIEADANEQGR